MSNHELTLIVISAFLHAFYNFMMRRSEGNQSYLLGIFVVAALIAALNALLLDSYRQMKWEVVPYIFAASFFYFLYQVFVSRAYRGGNISAIYPLTVLSPIFIPFWALFLLEERITPVSGGGIFLAVAGVFLVKLRRVSLDEFRKVFNLSADYSASRFALTASLFYSFAAVFDKMRVAQLPLELYLTFLLSFMALNMWILRLYRSGALDIGYYSQHWRWVLGGGLTVYLSFYLFRAALQVVDVSLAAAVRQVSIVFAILLGISFLKEKLSSGRILGSAIIVIGVILVKLGGDS